MINKNAKLMVVLLGAGLLAGCSSMPKMPELSMPKVSMPDLKFKNYIQDKQRVDREVDGPVGNWQNAPNAMPPLSKETRRMYIVEVTQDVELDPIEKTILEEEYVPSPSTYKEPIRRERKVVQERRVVLPDAIEIPPLDSIVIEDEYVPSNVSVGTGSFTEYTVEKNDTLQKISKKHYDSYAKWNKIYEANKNVLKSPDKLKPGMTLRIPSL